MPVLMSPHWPPVKQGIALKAATLKYKHLDSGLPQYFLEYIYYCTLSLHTRSVVAAKKFLVVSTF